jgi:hypothetical protein
MIIDSITVNRDGSAQFVVWWCLTPLSTIFQLYRGGQFYWWRKPEEPDSDSINVSVNTTVPWAVYKSR